MAVNVSPFLSVVPFPVGSPASETDNRRCSFSRKRGQWTLQADCELSTALDLPPNTALDGAGHTVTLVGDAEGFESAAIRASGAIVNLIVDGSQLLPMAPAYFSAIALSAPGRISQTTVRNIRFPGAAHTAIGVEIAAFGNAAVTAQDVTLENISGTGLLLTGDGQVSVESISVIDVAVGVQVSGTLEARLHDAAVEHSTIGILAQDQTCVRIDSTVANGEIVAEDQALIHQDTLTYIGAGDREQARRRAAMAATAPRDRLG